METRNGELVRVKRERGKTTERVSECEGRVKGAKVRIYMHMAGKRSVGRAHAYNYIYIIIIMYRTLGL